ncbi:MAG: hypothetical protein EOP10_02145 [Proteobacteria bacterium]|nr:MAG: hypothetical protein EOP10_02145 [Pseudomonadota bacterium]
MNSSDFNREDLEAFLAETSESTFSGSVPVHIANDLVSSKLRLSAIYSIGSLVGYGLSLAICAQCAIGLTPLSWKMASYLHSIPDPWCPILCGAVFGISPTLMSALYLSRFQHRFLIFRMGWLPALIPILGAFSLFLVGDSHSWQWKALWLISAIATPYLGEAFSALYLRQSKFIKDDGMDTLT